MARPVKVAIPLEPALETEYNGRIADLASTVEGDGAGGEPRDRIFYWYRLAARLLGRITKALLQPQQTLREFARENTKVLGAAAKYFVELTAMVERLLYSQYRPTEKDVENSKQLSRKTEEETKLQATAQPLPVQQLHEGGTLRAGQLGGLSTLPWVLLVLAVAYYACILLFLLPLLYVSIAG